MGDARFNNSSKINQEVELKISNQSKMHSHVPKQDNEPRSRSKSTSEAIKKWKMLLCMTKPVMNMAGSIRLSKSIDSKDVYNRERCATEMLNSAVDAYLEKVKCHLKESGNHAVRSDSASLEVQYEFSDWKKDAVVELEEGVIWDLSRLSRCKDAIIDVEHELVRIPLELSDVTLAAGYSWPRQTGADPSNSGYMIVSVPSCSASLSLRFDSGGLRAVSALRAQPDLVLHIKHHNVHTHADFPFHSVMPACVNRLRPTLDVILRKRIVRKLKNAFEENLPFLDSDWNDCYERRNVTNTSRLEHSSVDDGKASEEVLSRLKALGSANESNSHLEKCSSEFEHGSDAVLRSLMKSASVCWKKVKDRLHHPRGGENKPLNLEIEEVDCGVRASLGVPGVIVTGELYTEGCPVAVLSGEGKFIVHARLVMPETELNADYSLYTDGCLDFTKSGRLVASVGSYSIQIVLLVDVIGPSAHCHTLVRPDVPVRFLRKFDACTLLDLVDDDQKLSKLFWGVLSDTICARISRAFEEELIRA